MVKHILVVVAAAVVAAAAGFYVYDRYFVGDAAKIRRRFDSLAQYVDKSGKGGTTKMVLKTNAIATMFADPCSLEVPRTFLTGDYSRQEITANTVRARAMFKTIALSFHDLDVDVATPDRADAVFTARLLGETKTGKRVAETREMRADLRKVEGRWLFTNFKVVAVLKK